MTKMFCAGRATLHLPAALRRSPSSGRHYVEQQQTPDEQLTPCIPDLKDRALRRVFGKVDGEGNYTTIPDFAKMPAGSNMVNIARTVHVPTNASCLRCHNILMS
jgi:hypothetical protein